MQADSVFAESQASLLKNSASKSKFHEVVIENQPVYEEPYDEHDEEQKNY